jgi:hypothetical protein
MNIKIKIMEESLLAQRIIKNLRENDLSIFEAKKSAKILIYEFLNYNDLNKSYNKFEFLKYWNKVILEIDKIQ